MSTLKENWKKVGDELETFGKDFGKTLVKTVKAGAKVVSDWADKEDEPKADVTVEPEEKKE